MVFLPDVPMINVQAIGWIGTIITSTSSLGAHYIRKSVNREDLDDETSTEEQIRTPVGYSLLQLATRALLLASVVVSHLRDGSSSLIETAALAYVFALDLARVVLAMRQPSLRSSLLHHANVLVFVEAVAAFAQLSPAIVSLHDPQPAASRWLVLKLASAILALLCAFVSPREWKPLPLSFGLAQRELSEPSPEQTCSYFSYYMSYGWLTNLILRGTRRRLVLQDTLPLPEYDEPLMWKERIMEAREKYKTTAKTLAYALRESIAAMVFFSALTAVAGFISPLALYRLLHHIQEPELSTVRPWIWVALLFIGPVLRSSCYQQYIFNSTRLIVRTKMCLIQELYAKAGRCYDSDATSLPSQEKASSASGLGKDIKKGKSNNVTTLMAYDVDAICNSRDFIIVCTSTPIEITMGLVFLYILFGLYSLVALVLLLASFPLAALLSRLMSRFQRELMRRTDIRVASISEYLASIRTIKYLGWEPIMTERINAERRAEEKQIWRRNLSAVAVTVLGDFVPLLALFVMFATYTLVEGQPLTAAKAFTSVTIIESLRLQFVWIANATRYYSQARVAFGRIDKFMVNERETAPHPSGEPAFHNAVFRRAVAEDSFRLHIDCKFVPGGFNAIVGASGSGKSTLLLSLTGETILESGSAMCPAPVAYAPQIPWMLNDTVRANILMHQEFDAMRYKRVLHACALLYDLEKLDERDLTEVGVNGSNLSGGQRQRVCLARALYAQSKILVLDDIFSALDSATQKHIWDFCFCNDAVIQGRTVILVTQFQAAKESADLLVEISNGRVSKLTRRSEGTRQVRLVHDDPAIRAPSSANWVLEKTENAAFHHTRAIEKKINQEVAGEERNPRTLFYHYMYLFGGHSRAIMAMVICLCLQLAYFSLPIWLSAWVGAPDPGSEGAHSTGFYISVYGAILGSFLGFSILSRVYLQKGAWEAAHTMHEKLVSAAMWVSVHWYDKNPPGRFINRFSSDMFSMDCVMVDYLRIAMDNVFRFMLRLTAVGSIMPVFALPAAFVCTIGLVCAEMYTRTQLSAKALASAAQSPIFSFFVESMAGKAVIRSGPGFQAAFADDLGRRLRVYARSSETRFNLNRWICVRADGCAAVIAMLTGIIALSYGPDVSAGRLGFSLTSAIGLGQTILTMVRSMNDLEAEMNCFFRIREYASLPHEDDGVDDKDSLATSVPDHWPFEGRVQFEGVSVKYALDGPDILHDVSLSVSPGERVAIVGRTGSGKSTMALSLLGFTNITKGSVRIDGVDLAAVPLRVLRRRLTIIPQEPVLFSGDVRFNLDPAESSTSDQLTEAIGACSVMASLAGNTTAERHVDEQPIRALDLDTAVAPQGSNFSVGQRQVLSLARATVRQSQVVILDEATASIDYRSDVAIQKVLRSAFRGRTIIAIVHRLSTIMDYDRVIVMDAGQVRETGSPAQLYRQGGMFQRMVKQSIEHGKGSEWTPEKLQQLEK
ncbi:ABC multidrug transporter [Grosmannia clavigera kw1407]|uniref:ABC multidrug transporter n=1 Tax=Grosmannia clavigera (strain kw1407 / UAMH 11150) TaxID=655863 RepID=F0XJQ5_GROCL|nr:ABC multidrug transporter [Grosmannia clavigera kw1407]EFX02441.1 ABC multidrug transporter [Grosmannia clavigera kw1407]